MALDIKEIIQYPLKSGQFFEEEHPKKQLYIHHTSGSQNPFFVVDGWNNNVDKIGTPFIIAGKPKIGETKFKDGDILQCFSSKFWNYHLGVPSSVFQKYGIKYQPLDKTSIGIELTSWGYVTKQPNNTFKNYVGGIVPNEEVIDLGKEFRGYQYYHQYSDAQINSLKDLIIYLCDRYSISKKYNEGMWDINQGCLNGSNGIWSHTSCRSDKYDCFCQPSLINMLKSLENKLDTPINSITA